MDNYQEALLFAALSFRGAIRHVGASSYLAHSVAVSNTVRYYGGGDTLQIGALLHDVLEFKGQEIAINIEDQFGAEVVRVVWGCTDGLPDDNGKKPAWLLRKQAFFSGLATADPAIQLVALCDRLENARELVRELEFGKDLRGLFGNPLQDVLWSYQEPLKIFFAAKTPGREEYFETVRRLMVLATPDSSNE